MVSMETKSQETLDFEQSLTTLSPEELKIKRAELSAIWTDEAYSKLALVQKELEARARIEEGWESDNMTLEEKTMALNWSLQDIRKDFEEKRKGLKRTDKKYKELLEQESAAIKAKIEEFAQTDIRTFEGSKKSLEEGRDKAVNDLKALLDEKPSVTNAIKDTLSPSSIKLQKVDNHMQKLKTDRANYPGNMLRYLSRVSTSLFMTPFQKITWGLQSLSNMWASDADMGKRYDAIKTILHEQPWDSWWRKNLKQKMRTELVAAQTAFVDDARKRASAQVGLAA